MKTTIATTVKLFTVVLLLTLILPSGSIKAQDGKALFKQSCAMCHSKGSNKLVGPGLEGVTERRSEEWLLKWIKNSGELIKSGDPDAKKVYEENGQSPMPSFATLSDADIKAMLEYIKTPDAPAAPAAVTAPVNTPVAAPAPPMSTAAKWISFICIVVSASLFIYVLVLRKQLRDMGIWHDQIAFKDRAAKWLRINGGSLLLTILTGGLVLMILAVKNWMQ